jgi:hypothetical protein
LADDHEVISYTDGPRVRSLTPDGARFRAST